jgi:hypothetical protein
MARRGSAILLRAAWPLIAVVLLTSCVWTHHADYPEGWRPITTSAAGGACPDLSGVFLDLAEPSSTCPTWDEPCGWLSHNLLAGDINWSEARDESSQPAFPHGSHVELQQFGDERLEVILLDQGVQGQCEIVQAHTLRLADGDYECGPEGLTLRSRGIFVPAVIENAAGSMRVTLNRSADGYLIGKRASKVLLHMGIFLHVGDSVAWLRWAPSPCALGQGPQDRARAEP